MVTYVNARNSRNTEVTILHFFRAYVPHNKCAYFGSVILASDWVRVFVWNVRHAETGNLWFRDQFLVINEETYMNGLDQFIS